MQSLLRLSTFVVLLTHSASASTVTLDFDLDTLTLASSASIRAEKPRDVELRLATSDATRFGNVAPIPRFDEEANGKLERVDVSFDFDLPVVGFSVLDFFGDLNDPDTAFATSTFRASIVAFFSSGIQPPVRQTVFDQIFETSTEGCVPTINNFSCSTRDVFRMTPGAPATFSLVGDQLESVRVFHNLGLVISLELLSFDSNTNAYRTGAFISPISFDQDGVFADFSLTYHTTPVPLPAGAWLLISALGLIWVVRR